MQETGGYLMQLTSLRQGTVDLTASLQQIFGTTHLAPFGTLQGDVCFSGTTTLGAKTYTVGALNYELGNTHSLTLNVTLAAAASAPATVSAAPQSVTLAVADSNRSAATDVALNFTGGSPAWTANVITASAKWLTVSPASGTGSGAIKATVNSAGLSRGVYQAFVVVEAGGTLPQALQVPVTFVVGTSPTTTVTAIANGASYAQAFAPGMLLTVFGTQLSGVTRSATSLPLPLEIGGVSSTVNGVSAPLYYVSPGQVNVQIPYEVGIGPAVLGVNNGGQVANFPFTVAASAPGLFTGADGSLTGSVRVGATATVYMTGDGDTTTFLITGDGPPTGTATARLPRTKLPVTVSIGGVNATVTFTGTPAGMAGVSQVNFTVPANAPQGLQPLIVTVGGVRSQTARLAIIP
ncbi:MAG: hypothetical protein ABI806_07535 [Candidatus Solibacter sp.]